MSISTKFVPILQKSGGPGRWWRWQNKMVLKPETPAASFGTLTVAPFAGFENSGNKIEHHVNADLADLRLEDEEAHFSTLEEA